ncbi:MAG: VTT domain-containing protein [Rhodobacteraceae bacterium]|nr:VTT domain-containing protein [Paracoccaceae bacterium]
MTELLLELVSDYGLVILGGTVFLAALGAPLPGTVLLVLSGAFAAGGDMAPVAVILTAYFAAVAGDISGYIIGFKGGAWLQGKLRNAGLGAQIGKAEGFMAKWGGLGVFFSRWLVAPIGPTLNYVAGIGRFSWQRFVLWDMLGEAVWVGLYVAIGMVFSASALALVDMIASASWVIIGALGMYFMGKRLIKLARGAGKPAQ